METTKKHCNGGTGEVKFGNKEFNIKEDIIGSENKFEKVKFHVFFGNFEDVNKDFEGVLELEYIQFQQPINDVVDQFCREFCFQIQQVNFELKEVKELLEKAFQYALQDSEQYEEGVVSNYQPKQFHYIDLQKDQNVSAHQRRDEIRFKLGEIKLEEENLIIYGVDVSDVKFDSIRLKIEKQMKDNKPVIKFEILSSFYKIVHELDYMSKAYLIEKIIESFIIMQRQIFQNLEQINLTYVNKRIDYVPETDVNQNQNQIIPIAYSIMKDIIDFVIAHDDLFDPNYLLIDANNAKIIQNKHIQDQCQFTVDIQINIDESTKKPFAGSVTYTYKTVSNLLDNSGGYQYKNSQGFALDSQFNYYALVVIFLQNFIKQISTTVYQMHESKSQRYYAEKVYNPYADQILVNDKPVELVQAQLNQKLEPDILRLYTKAIPMNVIIPYNYGLKTVKVVFKQQKELIKKMVKKKRII